MTPSDYEQVVANIATGICTAAPELRGAVLGVGRSNRLAGASEYKHQIDVSLVNDTTIYLIECKRWEGRIGVEEVMVLAARASDIAVANDSIKVVAILASKTGATRGAMTLARHFGIQLEVVNSAFEFGLRIGQLTHVGLRSGLMIEDRATATLVK